MAANENDYMKDFKDYSLKAQNTFGIDAKCRRFIEYESDDEAIEVAQILRKEKLPYIIIGGGSNLLLTKDFDGIVVRSGIKGHYFEDDYFCAQCRVAVPYRINLDTDRKKVINLIDCLVLV